MRFLFTTALFTIIYLNGFCQKPFQGSITYEVSMKDDTSQIIKKDLPKYTYFFYKSDVILRIEGGKVGSKVGDFLIKGNEGKVYMLKRFDKIAYKVKPGNKPKPTVTPTQDKDTILGYPCSKYKVVTTGEAGTATQFVWTTEELALKTPKDTNQVIMNGGLFIQGVKGIPLKIETMMIQSGVALMLITEAKTVSSGKPENKKDFLIPKDFKFKEYNAERFGL